MKSAVFLSAAADHDIVSSSSSSAFPDHPQIVSPDLGMESTVFLSDATNLHSASSSSVLPDLAQIVSPVLMKSTVFLSDATDSHSFSWSSSSSGQV